ncbi:hypothetical protein D9Q98_006882 [Chlorella vulgaris]|uniref:MAGE domain-containing protein n=1 Tax=Chlorella vulgaris TaxID=3077 RepID=A0A9D4TJ04_CHLVU|nr:hypothetical protein D9Q98_006882 [Chlorella vulgaris]
MEHDHEEAHQPQLSEEARRRRKGKAPMVAQSEDEEEEEEEAEEQRHHSRRRAAEDEPGPSAKRRRSQQAVKQEFGGDSLAGPSRRVPASAAAAAAAAAGGAIRTTVAELNAVTELAAEYRRVRDHAAEKAEGKAPRMAMEQASRAVVRHMLFAHSEKPGVPVKRTEVAAVVTQRFPTVKAKGVVTTYVIAHAQHYLAQSMGLEMRSIHKAAARGRQGAAGGGDEGSQQFVLRSMVPAALRAAFVLDPAQSAERGLLMVVLALIHLAGSKLGQDELATQLAELGVSTERPHPVFGSLDVQLKSLCTRRYIQQDKQAGPDGDIVLYRFAEQAVGPDAEIGEPAILRFIESQFAEMRAAGGGGDGGTQ